MTYLIDTNTIIDYLNASLPETGKIFLNAVVDSNSTLSIITKMETLGYNFKSKNEQIIMETFIKGSNVLNINNEIVNQTILLRKSNKIKLPDAIIASTALVYDLIIISHNAYDFKNIIGLQLIDPYNI
ncbi:MAG: type II toxin-antitoxin system VapC family toxin [Cytophagales bacterium]|nr:MAG: type II toxin-antitoxin system VapC family toxin [Cytophagales bacterium]